MMGMMGGKKKEAIERAQKKQKRNKSKETKKKVRKRRTLHWATETESDLPLILPFLGVKFDGPLQQQSSS